MADAATFLRKVQKELEPIDAEIRGHAFLESVSSGCATIEGLRAVPGHQFSILESLIRSTERLVERSGASPSGSFFRRRLDGLRACREELPALARALGMSRDDLRAYEPHPAGFAYATYFAWLAEQGSPAEAAIAAFVNLPVWADACGRLSRGLHEYYGLGPRDTQVLDRYATFPSGDEEVCEIVQDGLDEGIPAERIARAAHFVQQYERDFWEAMSEIDSERFAWPPALRRGDAPSPLH